MQALCRSHFQNADRMSITFSKCRSYFSKCSLHVARITPVCSLHTTVCRMQQAACVLHEACMQGACISSVNPALEVSHIMRYKNLRFTYLLTYFQLISPHEETANLQYLLLLPCILLRCCRGDDVSVWCWRQAEKQLQKAKDEETRLKRQLQLQQEAQLDRLRQVQHVADVKNEDYFSRCLLVNPLTPTVAIWVQL